LGEAIAQIRAERGLSRGELAAKSGLELTSIEALESGGLDPRFDLLLTLAACLEVELSDFVLRAEALQGDGQGSASGPEDAGPGVLRSSDP
jgi:transcriptional regulator with XRE-family HTH domain